MENLTAKRSRLKEVNKQLVKLTKQPLYKLRLLDELSKKMMLENIIRLESEKSELLNYIVANK